MTDVNTTIDTSLDALEDYFGTSIDLEDFADMEASEIVDYFVNLFLAKADKEDLDLSKIDLKDITDPLDDILDELHLEIQTKINELNAILERGGNTVAYETSLQILIDSLNELDALTESKDGLEDYIEEALDDAKAQRVSVEKGDTYTVDFSNAKDGDVYVITAEEEDTNSGSIHNNETNKDWLNLDGDGYKETNPDKDGDGIADDDFDNDGVITEKDMTAGQIQSETTVVISDENIESTYVRSYDSETDTVELVVTFEDGSQVVVKVTGADKLVITPPPTNAEDIPTDLLAKIYESETAVNSEYYFVYGTQPETTESYYSIYDMKDQTDNTLDVPITDEDFENERAYTINCESGTGDTININLEDYEDAVVSFSTDENGNLVFTITTEEGSITITFVGLEYGSWVDASATDAINITGGEINEDSYSDLNDYLIPYSYNHSLGNRGKIFDLISHDGQTLAEEATADGYTIESDLYVSL